MKKTIYTLAIDNHNSDILEITMPAIERYADKIDAKIKIISERKWKNYPITYEKFQLFDYSILNDDDWSIYVDSDAYICNDFPDIVEWFPPNQVIFAKGGPGGTRFKYDNYFRAYDKHLDIGSWFFCFSRYTRNLVKPLHCQTYEPSVEDIISQPFPSILEKNANVTVTKEHIIDDYLLARNIAKYNLNVSFLCEIYPNVLENIYHSCFDEEKVKIAFLKVVREQEEHKKWSLERDSPFSNEILKLLKEGEKK